MKILSRYILKNNLLVMGICLLTCAGIYLLVDVFDRLDRMLEKGAAFKSICIYFGAKIPLILSQILPAVVFLSCAIQISGMQKKREMTALEAGGVSFLRLVACFLLLGLVWTGGQLVFSQVLGVAGQQVSESIWDDLGQEGHGQETALSDIWVRSQGSIVHLRTVWPDRGVAQGVRIYALDNGFKGLQRVIRAQSLQATADGWRLQGVAIIEPASFTFSTQNNLLLPMDIDMGSLHVSSEENDPEEMSLWELSAHIQRLQDSGTNVEVLRTAWHLKLSYAFSALILTAVALVLTRRWDNLFLTMSIGLGVIFLLFAVHTLGGTLGESGVLPSWLGAWLGNLLVGTLVCLAMARQIRGRV